MYVAQVNNLISWIYSSYNSWFTSTIQ